MKIIILKKNAQIVITETYNVKAGDIILIPDGDFHRVWNEEEIVTNDDLEFICVFDGGRNH